MEACHDWGLVDVTSVNNANINDTKHIAEYYQALRERWVLEYGEKHPRGCSDQCGLLLRLVDRWTYLTASLRSTTPVILPGKTLYRRASWYTIRDNHLNDLLSSSIDDKGVEGLLISKDASHTSPPAGMRLRPRNGTSLQPIGGSQPESRPRIDTQARRGTKRDPFPVPGASSRETTPRPKKNPTKERSTESSIESAEDVTKKSPDPSPPSLQRQLSSGSSASVEDTAPGATGGVFGAISDIVVGYNKRRGALEQVETVKDTLSEAQRSWSKRMVEPGQRSKFKMSAGVRQEAPLQNRVQDLERRLALVEEEAAGMRQHTAHMVAAVDDMFNTFRNCQVTVSVAVGGLVSGLEDVATTLVNRLATEAGQKEAHVRVEVSRYIDETPGSSRMGGKDVQAKEGKKLKRKRVLGVDGDCSEEKQQEGSETFEGLPPRKKKKKSCTRRSREDGLEG